MSMNPPTPPTGGEPPYTPPYQPQGSAGYPPAGYPPPYSAPSIAYASIGRRFVAVLIDGLIIGIPLLIISAIVGYYATPLAALLNVIAYFLYEGLMLANNNGQTLGKQIMSVRVVAANGQQLTQSMAFTRAGVKALFSVIGSISPRYASYLGILSLIDYLWPFWDANKQTLHDKAASTYVVDARGVVGGQAA